MPRTRLHLNLGALVWPVILLVGATAPLMRGLFFPEDRLPVEALIGVLFALAVLHRLLRGRPVVPVTPVAGAAVAWAAVAYLGIGGAADHAGAVDGFLLVTAYAAFYAAALTVLDSPAAWRRWALALSVGGVLVAGVGLGAALGVVHFPGAVEGGRLMSTFQYPNALAGYLAMQTVLAVGWAATARGGLGRAAALAAGALAVAGLVGTNSRGTWLVLPLALALYLGGVGRASRWAAVYATAFILTGGLVAARGFFPQVESSHRAALLGLAAGLVVAVMGAALERGWSQLSRGPLAYVLELPGIAAKLRWAGLAYAAGMAGLFAYYTWLSVPQPLLGILPGSAVQRVQQIDLHDPSAIVRMLASRDGLELWRQRPLLGWGHGGWNALYHTVQPYLYWTTEVHNHYVQTLVEYGALGLLAFLVLAVAAPAAAVRAQRVGSAAKAADWTIIWALAAAGVAELLHAGIDFDFSFPSIVLTLLGSWACLEAFAGLDPAAGGAGGVLAGVSGRQTVGTRRPFPSVPPILGDPSRLRWASRLRVPLRLGVAAAAVAAGALLFVHTSRLYDAGTEAARGAQAMLAKQWVAARDALQTAHAEAPWTGAYTVDLAQATFAIRLQEDGGALTPAHRQEVARLLLEASHVQPDDLALRMKLAEVYALLGMPEETVTQAQAAERLAPLDPDVYVLEARTGLAAIYASLHAGDRAHALAAARRIADLPARWTAAARAGNARLPEGFFKNPEEPRPELVLGRADALYVMGLYDDVAETLRPFVRPEDWPKLRAWAQGQGSALQPRASPGTPPAVAAHAFATLAAAWTWQYGHAADAAVQALLAQAEKAQRGSKAVYLQLVSVHAGG
ncbi:MAG: O-antigen ligase family protein [Firmicutes bacterium]|nr:O-antigen ligase family protein [Bacillota bacterium]